jgi:hypothetical protein
VLPEYLGILLPKQNPNSEMSCLILIMATSVPTVPILAKAATISSFIYLLTFAPGQTTSHSTARVLVVSSDSKILFLLHIAPPCQMRWEIPNVRKSPIRALHSRKLY